jgi:thiamine biosynthesis lipoprotein
MIASDPRPTNGVRRVEHLWGTAITVDVRESTDPAVLDDVFAWFRRVDDLFSTWRPDTEVSRYAAGELAWRDLSDEVRTVLEWCDRMGELSRGAFDARVGADPRVAPREGLGPVDPSGLVKGWALDRAAELFQSHGVEAFAIAAGGDVVTAGEPTPGRGWRVGIQHPWERQHVAAVVEVSGVGVATSGRYERGDHIIDPRTGDPAIGIMAVTVVADELASADGCATAALVLGADGAAWLTEEMGLAALVIADDGGVLVNAAFDRLRCDADPDAGGGDRLDGWMDAM